MGQDATKQNRPQIEGDFSHLVYQVGFDVDVYGSVSGKGSASLFVSTEAADKIRVLDFVVKVPNKSSSSKM